MKPFWLNLVFTCWLTSNLIGLIWAQKVPLSVRDRWLGTFEPIAGCIPSNTCCCSTSNVTVSKGSSDDGVFASGKSDGGQGCYNMKQMQAPMTLQNPSLATFTISQMSITVSMTMDPAYNFLTITSSNYANCKNSLRRRGISVAPSTPVAAPASATSTTSATTTPVATTTMPPGSSSTSVVSTNSPTSTPFTNNMATIPLTTTNPWGMWHRVFPLAGTNNGLSASSPSSSIETKQFMVTLLVPRSSNVDAAWLNIRSETDSPDAFRSMSMSLMDASSTTTQSSSMLTYAYQPLSIVANQKVYYWFTYTKDGKSFSTAQYMYPSDIQAQANGMINTTGMAPVLPNWWQTSTKSPSHPMYWYVGRFKVAENKCIPSPTCCCGVGALDISPNAGTGPTLAVDGELDGGSACLYLRKLNSMFSIDPYNPTSAVATINYPPGYVNMTISVYSSSSLSPSSTLDGTQPLSSSSFYDVITLKSNLNQCITTSYREVVAPASVPATPSTAATVTAASSTAVLPRDNFVGVFQTDNTCIPSADCCCAVGNINIGQASPSSLVTPLPASLSSEALEMLQSDNATLAPLGQTSQDLSNLQQQVVMSVKLDAGSACFGMKSISQVFTLSSSKSATFDFSGIGFTANLSDDLKELSFTNSMYSCPTKAVRISNTPVPSSVPISISTPISTPAAVSRPANSLLNFQGSYVSDGTCKPSPMCCCAYGVTKVSMNASKVLTATVNTQFQGEKYACLSLDGVPVSMDFSIVNASFATSTFSRIRFQAHLSSDLKTVKITNSLHEECPSVLVKADNPNQLASVTNSASTIVGGADNLLFSFCIFLACLFLN